MPQSTIEVIARGVWWWRDQLLVCRNLKHGYSYLPGGHVEFGESCADALRREFQEEAGIVPEVGAMLAVIELRFNQRGRERHEVSTVFHVKHGPIDDAQPPSIRSLESKIAFDWVPTLSLAQERFEPSVILPWLQQRHLPSAPMLLSFDQRSSE